MYKSLLLSIFLSLFVLPTAAQITLSHNIGDELVERRIFACSYGGLNWARAFNLQDFGVPITENFIIESGQVAFYDTYVPVAGHVVFNIYEIDTNFPAVFDETRLLGSSQQVSIRQHQGPELYNVQFDNPVIVPAGVQRILVEVKQVPNFANSFVAFIASTDQGTDESYIKSDFGGCFPLGYYSTPEDLGRDFGTHFYITVNGEIGDFVIRDELNCTNSSIDFAIDGLTNFTAITWDFGDGTTSDQANPNNVYAAPGTYTVLATVTTTTEVITQTKEVIVPEPVFANSPGIRDICNDNGINTISLSDFNTAVLGAQNNPSLEVYYYNSQENADNDTDRLNYNHWINGLDTEVIFARIALSDFESCYATTSFQLNYFTRPIAPNIPDWQVCDDDQDGIYDFNLNLIRPDILSSAPSSIVTFYTTAENAQLALDPLPDTYQNIDSNETIYFRMENQNNSECYSVSSFDLSVSLAIAYQPEPMVRCDDNESGLYTFDLSQKDVEVLNGQAIDRYDVLYFTSELDALNNENAVDKLNYENSGYTDTLFIRLQNLEQPTCYAITNFQVIVNPLPVVNLLENYIICPDSPTLIIDGGDFETYIWENGQGEIVSTSATFTPTELGNYSLTVTEINNGTTCENRADFSVRSSGAPEAFTVLIEGFTDQISLTINASGIGDFEYSLDGFSYQTENIFDVFPGTYTVFVRDPLGCRELTEEVVAIGYQKFFTPNGDNVNEYWNIIGGGRYPGSQLYIYDRYGNLLTQLDANSNGWNGDFLGKPMPSSDYWFKYVYDNSKIIKGHFTLKR